MAALSALWNSRRNTCRSALPKLAVVPTGAVDVAGRVDVQREVTLSVPITICGAHTGPHGVVIRYICEDLDTARVAGLVVGERYEAIPFPDHDGVPGTLMVEDRLDISDCPILYFGSQTTASDASDETEQQHCYCSSHSSLTF